MSTRPSPVADPARRKAQVKLVLAAILALLCSTAAIAIVGGAGLLLVATERNPAAPGPENVVAPQLDGLPTWSRATDATELRLVNDALLARIAGGYVRAWRTLDASLAACADQGLSDSFAAGALAGARAALDTARATGCTTRRTASSTSLVLRFVSADGAIVAFTDTGLSLSDTVPGPDGRPVAYSATESREVVMVLDDGVWRVHLWRGTRAGASGG